MNRDYVFQRDMYQCQKCGLPATEIAHKIANTISNAQEIAKKYSINLKDAKRILNHPLNLSSSCRACNDSFNIGFKRRDKERLIDLIINFI